MANDQVIPFQELHSTIQDFSVYLYACCGSAATTVELLTGCIRRAAPQIGLEPSTLEIEQYVAKLRQTGISYASIANTITALTHFMRFRGAPVRLARPRKPKPLLVGTLSEAEIAIIIAGALSLRERAILTLLAYSGIRNLELCSLLVRDIDLPAQMVTIETAKGEAKRRVCIEGRAVEVLAEYLRVRGGLPQERLFVTIRHRHGLATQDLRKIIHVAASRVGIRKRVYPHLFRHSLATNMLHRGANLLTIKDQLGHAFIDTTLIYVHSTRERLAADYRAFAPSYL